MTRREWKFLCLLIAIFIAAGLETDIYLPAFTDMMAFFKTDEEHIQQLLTWNFAGMCISGPLYGPISDAHGRRRLFVLALGIFLAGCLVTLLANDFHQMLGGRVLQGIGSGGCFTLGTALIFDAFEAERAVTALNHINSIFPFVLAGAPALGSYLNLRYGFRANFLAVTVLVLWSFTLAALFLPETLPVHRRHPLRWTRVAADFKTACTSVPFWQLVLAICLFFSLWMAFLSTVSVLFVLELGVPKERFAWYQSVPLAAWLAGSLSASPLIKRAGHKAMKHLGIWALSVGALSFVVGACLAPREPWVLVITMSLYALGLNWFQGIYFPAAMELHPNIKGVTASILTSCRLLICAVVVALTGHYYNRTIYLVAVAMGLAWLLGMAMILSFERHGPKRSESDGGSPVACLH